MFNNLVIKGLAFASSKGYEQNLKKLQIINQKIEKIATNIISNKKRIGDNTFFHTLLGLIQRPAYRKRVKKTFKNSFSINDDACIRCKKCVKSCPTGAISFINNNIAFNNPDKCTICFRCYNFCPKSAIRYNGNVEEPLFKGPTKQIYDELFNSNETRRVNNDEYREQKL